MRHAARVRRRALGLALLGALAALAGKLWLVHPDEVVARANPYDQQLYAELADAIGDGRWLGAYDHRTLVREPLYPAWVAAVARSGVRLRLASELLLAAAAAVLCAALLRAGLSPGLAAAAFAGVVLEPHSLIVHRELLAAGLYLPLLLATLAGLLAASLAARTRGALAWAAATGPVFGAAWVARPEKPVLVLLLVAYAAGDALRRTRRGAAPLAALGRGAAVAAGVAVVGAAVPLALAQANAARYGLRVTSDLSAPGFVASQRELHGIPHERPRRRVLVPRDARERAYRASPSLRALAPAIEAPGWPWAVSCNRLEICDELGGSWFMWALREAAAAAGHDRSATAWDAAFARIAAELASARARGDLAPRRPAIPVLHPYPGTFLAEIPASLWRLAHRAVRSPAANEWRPPMDAPATPAAVRALFDRVARRDPERATNGRLALRGTVASADDPVVGVSWRPHAGPRAPREPAQVLAAPDAAGRRAFRLRAEKQGRAPLSARPVVEVALRSGARVRFPLEAEPGARTRAGVELVVQERVDERPPDRLRDALRRGLWGLRSFLWAIGVPAALGAVAVVVRRSRRGAPARGGALGLAAFLCAVLAAGRLGLLALVDASTMPMDSVRYVYPAVPFVGLAALLACVAAFSGGARAPAPASARASRSA